MKLSIISRADRTGLGNQTRSLIELLRPNKILVIDSSPFNKGIQNFSYFKSMNAFRNLGMLRPSDGIRFIRGVDIVLSCETFYSSTFVRDARLRGVKTILQYNYEFLSYNEDPTLPLPDILLSPSLWRIDEAKDKFGDRVVYLPPPTDETKFEQIRNHNLNRQGKKKFLHIVGNRAAHDRNGTDDLIKALKHTEADFELHIKTQYPLEIDTSDSRVIVDTSNPLDETELYRDYDAMILPRRYAGLCLPMNEALMSGLPVIMPDIDPNNKLLPKEWLVSAHKIGEFQAKTTIDVYESDFKKLAKKLDWLYNKDLREEKQKAYQIGYDNFSFEILQPKYEELIGSL